MGLEPPKSSYSIGMGRPILAGYGGDWQKRITKAIFSGHRAIFKGQGRVLGILGDEITHKYPLYRAYIGISHDAVRWDRGTSNWLRGLFVLGWL